MASASSAAESCGWHAQWGDGAVQVVRTDGTETTVMAKAVLMATGRQLKRE